MKRSESISVKDLLLMLNLKAHKTGYSYVLQYNYSYHSIKRKLFTRSLVLKFCGQHLIKKNQLYSQEKIVEYIIEEMKLYK